MSSLVAITSRKGVILSYRPLVRTRSILVFGDLVVSYSEAVDACGIVERYDGSCIEVDDYIVPAFIDPHVHPESLGFETEVSIFSTVKDRHELYETLRKTPVVVGDWILAKFDHLQYHDRKPPLRRELDDIFPDKPVLLIHRSGHFGVLNSIGLRLAAKYIAEASELDQDNGFIYEKSLMILRERILSRADDEFILKALRRAQDHFISHGVLSIGVAGCDHRVLSLLKSMDSSGDLRIRTYVYLLPDGTSVEAIVREYVESRILYRRLRVNGVKIILDGALGPRTAYLSRGYSDDPANKGLLLLGRETLSRLACSVNKYGLQLAIHAIGDAALDIVLDVLEDLGEDVERLKHRIEHVSLVRDDQIARISRLKPVLVVQPHFILSDVWIHERLGEDRLRWAYRFATLYRSSTVAFSTDAPVEPIDPWRTIYAATGRGFRERLSLYNYTFNERMEILDALHCYTKLAGLALRDERLGSLMPGSYADFLVVDRDPTEVKSPEELLNIRVLNTSVNIMRGL